MSTIKFMFSRLADDIIGEKCRGDLDSNLGENGDGNPFSGAHGPLMCILALLAFLLVISKELNAAVRVCAAVLARPRGGKSEVTLTDDNEISIERLSYARLVSFLFTTALR